MTKKTGDYDVNKVGPRPNGEVPVPVGDKNEDSKQRETAIDTGKA